MTSDVSHDLSHDHSHGFSHDVSHDHDLSHRRVLVADPLSPAGLARLSAAGIAVDAPTGLARDVLLATIGGYDALIVRSATQVDRAVLDAGRPRLAVVARAGAGVDNIDVAAAKAFGIHVLNTPGANSVATAEMAFALLLALVRHIAPAHASLGAREWRRGDFGGTELAGKTLGLIGFGRVARLVALRALAFEMKVIACSPGLTDDRASESGVRRVDLPTLLAESDAVSLHAALTEQSRHLIDAAALARMRPTAVLINGARGGLVDEGALAEALRTGRLRAAAVDVYAVEPPPADHPLLGLPNVLHTPHLGASTAEAQANVSVEAADGVVAVLRGERADGMLT